MHCLQELAAFSSLSDGIVDVVVVVAGDSPQAIKDNALTLRSRLSALAFTTFSVGHEHPCGATENAHVPHVVPGTLGTRAAAPGAAWLIVRFGLVAAGRDGCHRHGCAMFCHRSQAGVGTQGVVYLSPCLLAVQCTRCREGSWWFGKRTPLITNQWAKLASGHAGDWFSKACDVQLNCLLRRSTGHALLLQG